MSARRTAQNWGQPTAQRNDAYSDYSVNPWGGGLEFGDTHEGMLPSNVGCTVFKVNTTSEDL